MKKDVAAYGREGTVVVCEEMKKGREFMAIPSREQLEQMKKLQPEDVDREQLVDLTSVVIDESLPLEERRRQFLEQIGNPYLFRVGEYVVKLEFDEEGESFEECLAEYLQARDELEKFEQEMKAGRLAIQNLPLSKEGSGCE